jgi:hypothetical protein
MDPDASLLLGELIRSHSVASFSDREHADYRQLACAYLEKMPFAADWFQLGDFSIAAIERSVTADVSPCIRHEILGKLDGLTHRLMVAKRCWIFNDCAAKRFPDRWRSARRCSAFKRGDKIASCWSRGRIRHAKNMPPRGRG